MIERKPQLLAHINKMEQEVLTYMDLLIKCAPDERAFVMPAIKPLPDMSMENTR